MTCRAAGGNESSAGSGRGEDEACVIERPREHREIREIGEIKN
jgi:hypothetical protein